MVSIPFKKFPAFTEDVILDNVAYRFSFNWNGRGQYWSMTMADINNNILLAGIKIMIQAELIQDFPGRGLPPGAMIAFDPGRKINQITQTNLGDTVSLIYITAAEVEILDAGGSLGTV